MIWIIPLIIFLGMWGGQRDKIVRRLGVSASAILAIAKDRKGKEKRKGLIFAWLLVALSLGYGKNSTLLRICGSDWLTRIVYGLIVSFPFLFFGLWYAPLVLPVAYSIRAGGFKLGKYDWLWEDFIRFSAIGTLVYISLM